MNPPLQLFTSIIILAVIITVRFAHAGPKGLLSLSDSNVLASAIDELPADATNEIIFNAEVVYDIVKTNPIGDVFKNIADLSQKHATEMGNAKNKDVKAPVTTSAKSRLPKLVKNMAEGVLYKQQIGGDKTAYVRKKDGQVNITLKRKQGNGYKSSKTVLPSEKIGDIYTFLGTMTV